MNASATSVAPHTREWTYPRQIATWAARGPGVSCDSASDLRYSALVNQPRRSTRSRCMYPMSATGPPKPALPRYRKYLISAEVLGRVTPAGVISPAARLGRAIVRHQEPGDVYPAKEDCAEGMTGM